MDGKVNNTQKMKSKHIAFSAPSGGGKTTIIKKLLPLFPQLALSVSATTRKKRPGEIDGQDYYFLSLNEFNNVIKEGHFLEYEEVHGNFYGTRKDSVDALTAAGKTVVFDIDVKGAQSIRNAYPDTLCIFINPPSEEVLIQRLRSRMSEDDNSLSKRLERIRFEYNQAHNFDHVIVNDDLNEAVEKVKKLILA